MSRWRCRRCGRPVVKQPMYERVTFTHVTDGERPICPLWSIGRVLTIDDVRLEDDRG